MGRVDSKSARGRRRASKADHVVRSGKGRTVAAIGATYSRDLQLAKRLLRGELAEARSVGDKDLEAVALMNLTNVHFAAKAPEKALLAATEALKVLGPVGSPSTRALLFLQVGNACLALGEIEAARDMAVGSGRIAGAIEAAPIWALALQLEGRALIRLSDGRRAARCLVLAETMLNFAGGHPDALDSSFDELRRSVGEERFQKYLKPAHALLVREAGTGRRGGSQTLKQLAAAFEEE